MTDLYPGQREKLQITPRYVHLMKKLFAFLLLLPAVAFAQSYPSPTFNTLTTNGNITQPSTGEFYSQRNAIINRINDRIFLGGYTAADGTYPPVTNDWFSTYQDSVGYVNAGPIASLNVSPPNTLHGGTIAGEFASQSVWSTSAGTSTIPVESFAINNNATLGTGAWAYYGEAHRVTAAASTTYGMELDTHSIVTNGAGSNPYSQGLMVALQLASGAGVQGNYFTGTVAGTVLTVAAGNPQINYNIQAGSIIYGVGVTAGTVVTSLGTGTGGNGTYNINNSQSVSSEFMVATPQYDASAAIQIESNPVKFQSGIVFGSTSLTGDDGVKGTAQAISLAKGHTLQWYMPGPLPTSAIASNVSVQADATGIDFNNNGMEVYSHGANEPAVAFFYPNTTGVNYLAFQGGSTGQSATIFASGTDTNVGLTLQAQGSGQVSTGTSGLSAGGNDAMSYSNTSAQSIANLSQTTVTGWTKVLDRLSTNFNASTGVFTAPVSGYYNVAAGIDYATSAPSAIGEFYRIYAVANGAGVCAGANNAQTTTAMDHPVNLNCTILLAAGQTLVIQALQNSGAAVTLSGAGALDYVSIARVP